MIDYCWSHFNHQSDNGDVYELWHFRLFPYLLVVITIIIYGSQISWRAMNFEKAIHALDYIIDGLEGAIRDVIIQMENERKKEAERKKSESIEVDGSHNRVESAQSSKLFSEKCDFIL